VPVKSAKQYGFMQAVKSGKAKGIGPSKDLANEFIHSTPPDTRSKFAKALKKKRKSA